MFNCEEPSDVFGKVFRIWGSSHLDVLVSWLSSQRSVLVHLDQQR